MNNRPGAYSNSLPTRRGQMIVPGLPMEQDSLFPLRISTTYPEQVNGKHIRFSCQTDRGGLYYCKADADGRPIRVREWLFTNLARHVGIVTPECAVLERPETGETFFGSLQVASPAGPFEVQSFLSATQRDELGQPSGWLGSYLSGLCAYDLFCANPDRGFGNFLLSNEGFTKRLCAFDFGSASLRALRTTNFPVAPDATVRIGRVLRHRHGFFPRSAIEMVDRLAAVPEETIAGLLKHMPDDWMTAEDRGSIAGLWSRNRLGERLSALRSGIADESLL